MGTVGADVRLAAPQPRVAALSSEGAIDGRFAP